MNSTVDFELDDDGEKKPVRLEDETASYLAQIESSLDDIDDSDEEATSLLLENVMDELKSRTASAAADRRTHAVVEKLIFYARLHQCIELTHRLTPYINFLARNRHASHVLQSLIARVAHLIRNVGSGTSEEMVLVDDEAAYTKLGSSLKRMFDPILLDFAAMASDMNGSHVVRAVFCVCAGLPVVAEKRGKNAKHAHSVSLTEPLEKLLDPQTQCMDHGKSFFAPAPLTTCLLEAAERISDMPMHTLQEMSCDAATAAVFNIMMRILFNPSLVPGGEDVGNSFLLKLLQWTPQDRLSADGNDDEGADGVEIVYQIAGNKNGSFFLECVLDCAPSKIVTDVIARGIVNRQCTVPEFATTAVEFATDGSANFVLQACLRRLETQSKAADSSGSRARKAGRALLEVLIGPEQELPNGAALTADGQDIKMEPTQVSKLCGTRGGVVLRMLTLAGELVRNAGASSRDKMVAVATRLAKDVVGTWMEVQSSGVVPGGVHALARAQQVALLVAYFARRMQPLVIPAAEKNAAKKKGKGGKGDERSVGPVGVNMNSQIILGRLMGAVMGLGAVSAVSCAELVAGGSSDSRVSGWLVVEAVSQLEGPTVAYMACNGALSKGCMDVLLDLMVTGAAADEDAGLAVLAKLAAGVEKVGQDRVGQHCIRKAFASATERGKELLSAACADRDVMARLTRSQEGRNTVANVHAEVYARGAEEFSRLLKKQDNASSLLDELGELGKGTESTGTQVPANRMGQADWSKFEASATTNANASEEAGSKDGLKDGSSHQGEEKGTKKDKKDKKERKESKWADKDSEERRRQSSDNKKRKASSAMDDAKPNMHLVHSLNSSKLGSAAGLLEQIEASKKRSKA